MIREKIREFIKNSCENLFSAKKLRINIEKTSQKDHGDYTVNIRGLSQEEQERIIIDVKKLPDFKEYFSDVKFEKPIFINFFLSNKYLQEKVKEILKQKEKFGEIKIGKGEKVNLEFISANPTGPLTLGNGRGGFCGDALANILNKAGFKVKKEYYINDTGEQIRKLGHSVIDDSQAVYKGRYVQDLKKKIKGTNPEAVGKKAAKIILEKMIKPSVKKAGIKFDVWFSEKSLSKDIEKVLIYLKKKNLTYEKEGALWFKSSQLGDEKDRVLIKADGEKTYIASDFAYLKNKFERGFDRLIYIWGADHYGYINRLKAASQALGFEKEKVEIIIMQLIRLFEKGQEVRMSKRTGIYVTLDELIEEIGLDAARFFFMAKNPTTHLDFDMSLAKEKSEKNPVYYVQYAYARICSILKKIENKASYGNYELLKDSAELKLTKELIRFPEIIEDTAKDYQIQRTSQYATNLANTFHQFYGNCQVISKDEQLTKARISLILATKIVLKNTLDLMGISAPEKM
jgi:arginyl-tRNA synthetase